MKVALSTIGKFHTFDLARELYSRSALAGICTGYPYFKLRSEALPRQLIHSFPWVQGAYMSFPWKQRLPGALVREWQHISSTTFGRYVARHLPECDVYVGLSGSSLPAGRLAHQRGVKYVCDRGSSHIRVQDRLLREEHDLWGMPFGGVDPRTIEREEAEYAEADCVTVPSSFAYRSFVDQGHAPDRLRLLPYGVNLTRFEPVAEPAAGHFDVLFVGGMSLRKGVQYLVQAYAKLAHPAKSLTFVGTPSEDMIQMLKARGLWPKKARALGHVPQPELKNLMSRSHVMVLPSIEDGFGMVMSQAMACGCPVIASHNTGAKDLFEDGEEGLIVPIRDVDALTGALQRLVDDPVLRDQMGAWALARVRGLGGWHDYGEKAVSIYRGYAN